MDPAITGLVSIIKEGGPWALSAVFIFLWWEERRERREAQANISTLQDNRLNDAVTRGQAAISTIEKNTTSTEAQSELIKAFLDRVGRT